MGHVIAKEPPRIVCTKCVRIVRVHFFDLHFADDTMTLATECCERIFGWVDGELLKSRITQCRSDFTTADIVRIEPGDVDNYAKDHDLRAAKAMARAKWARWAIDSIDLPGGIPGSGVG